MVSPGPRGKAQLPLRALQDMDWIRGVAALAVLAGHVRGLFLVDYGDIVQPSLALRLLYFCTGLGHQAVIVFFVLSGFFVGYSVLSARERGSWSWRHYSLRRGTRLYVVLVPALLLTAALDVAGIHSFGVDGTIYSGDIDAPHLTLPDVARTLTPGVFLGNLAMLQHVFGVPEFGSNGPLWSLSYEFWAYLLFPLAVATATRSERPFRRACFGSIACAILVLGGANLLVYLGLWSMGAAVAWMWVRAGADPRRRTLPHGARMVAITLFLVALALARLRLLGIRHLEDGLLALATSGWVFVMVFASASGGDRSRTYVRAGAWLAGLSYTLYLTHYPLLTLLHAATMDGTRMQPGGAAITLCGCLVVAVVVCFAAPVAWLTERRTDSVRQWLTGVGGGGAAVGSPRP